MSRAVTQKSPYEHPSGEPGLRPSFVCYADVLGYAQESLSALTSGGGEAYLRRLRETFNAAYARVREAGAIDGWERRLYDVKFFTDNIVIGYPTSTIRRRLNNGESELGHILDIFIELQASFAMQGFFIRGGIAYGAHYMDDDIVFGEALLEAIGLDKTSGPPHLALAPTAVELVRGHLDSYLLVAAAPHYKRLLEDADGTIFLNYLYAAFEAFPDIGVFYEIIEKHRDAIRVNLARFKGAPGIRSKYEWAARYHNFVCRDFVEQNPNTEYLSEYLIEESELAVSPQRISLTPLSLTP